MLFTFEVMLRVLYFRQERGHACALERPPLSFANSLSKRANTDVGFGTEPRVHQ